MIYNVRSGMALTHAINHKVGGAVGKFIGGNAYTKARNKGATRKQALQSSASARINEHKAKPSKKPQNKAQKVLGGITRFATMPAGMLHDISQGGVIAMGKNFGSRLNNAMHGNTVFNHNDVPGKSQKKKLNARTEAGGGNRGKGGKKPRKPNNVMRRDDGERRTIGRKPKKGGK